MSYQVSYSGRSRPGSDKIRYYQSPAYGEKAAPVEGYIVTGAYSQGTYGAPSSGYHHSSAGSVPRSARKYQVGGETRRVPPETNKTCVIVVIVVGVAILVAAAIALGVVFGVVNKAGDKKPETTTPRPATAVSYDVSLTSDNNYIPEYDDPTSAEYQALENEAVQEVTSAVTDSELGSSLIEVKLLGLEPGSTILLFKVFFHTPTAKINAQNVAITALLVKTTLVSQFNAPKRAAFVQAKKILIEQTAVKLAANNGRKDLGESCVLASECSDTGAGCIGSKCTCMSSYYRKGRRCAMKIAYDGTGCSASQDCSTANAICSANKCTCDSTARFYKSSQNACVPKLGLNQPGCTKASDCASPDAMCSSGKCMCTSDKFEMNGVCVNKIAMYGKGCGGENSHCATPAAECRSNYCRCPVSRFYNGAHCVNKFAYNTAGCTAASQFQCATPGAVCVLGSGTTGVCQCPTGTHTYRSGRCVRDVECDAWYQTNLNQIWNQCRAAADKIKEDTPEGKCWHYENYMGCIMYLARVQDVDCSMERIDRLVPDQSPCPGNSYAYLEGLLPTTRAGFCTNAPTARYLIRYNCLTYDPEFLRNDQDRCRALLTLQGCVFNTLHRDAGCDMPDVVELLKHEDVKSDLLDDIPMDCDTLLQVTKCEKLGLQTALVNQHCLYPPTQMSFATILSDPSSFNSYNSQKKLKCSVYEESLTCLINEAGGALDDCSVADLAPVVKVSVRLFRDVMAKMLPLPAEALPLFTTIDFSICDAALSGVVPTDQCLSGGKVADQVVASCMAQVFEVTRTVGEDAACLRLPAFEACVKYLRLPNAEKCRENHVWTSIAENIDFVKTTIDGFDPIACNGTRDKKCSVSFAASAKEKECAKAYHKMVSPDTADAAKCRHFEAFLSCIKFHALLYGETCPYETIRNYVRSTDRRMKDFDICYACDYTWPVRDNDGKWSGLVSVRLENLTQHAIISGVVYNLAATEYVGIGISQNNLMSGSDIYTVQPLDVAGENWTVLDRYAAQKTKPTVDTSQDVTVHYLHYYDNKVGVTIFSRKIDTGDASDFKLSADGFLLFARGPMSTLTSVTDILKHSFKAVSADKMSFSSCDPYTYLSNSFPATREQACTNAKLHRHLWEYECLPFDFSELPNQMDRCRTEISRRQCVFNIFQESGLPCTLPNIVEMSQKPEVRAGLLDYVDIDCESVLPDTECEKSYMYEAAESAGHCFSPIHNLNSFVFHDDINNIDNYTSANGQKKLKCSIFEEHLKCYFGKVSGTQCSPAQIAAAVIRMTHVAFNINFNNDKGRDKPEVSFESCKDDLPVSMPKTCPSRAAVADMVVAQCGADVLEAIEDGSDSLCETAGNALKRCLEHFSMPNNDMCGEDHLESSLGEYSDFIARHMKGFNYRTCQSTDCGTWYNAHKIGLRCLGAAIHMAVAPQDEKCWHFEQFMGCVKYASIVSNVDCSMQVIDGFMPEYSICPGHDYNYLENQMPANKAGLCYNTPSVRYMIRYSCLKYKAGDLDSDQDRCRALLTIEGCVYQNLHADAGCSIGEVASLMRNPEVQLDLHGFPKDCDTRLSVSDCERAGLQAANTNQQCFATAAQFMNATMYGTSSSSVDTFTNHNGLKKLKCSIYEESLKCLMNVGRTLGSLGLDQCSAADLAVVAKSSLRIFYHIAGKQLPAEARPYFQQINFDECDAGLSTVVASDECPSSGAVADLAVATCMSKVFEATRYTNESKCLRLPAFQGCVGSVRFPNAEKCREDHVWTSIAENIDFVRNTLDGFDPLACDDETKKICSVFFAERAKTNECKGPYGKLVDPETPADQRCLHFEHFLSCIKFFTLLYGETCSYETIRDLAHSANQELLDYDICYACNYPWAIKNDNTEKWSGLVNVRIQTRTQTAEIQGIVYDLAATGLEYVGIGISQNNLMSQSDIYTVAPLNSSGENWVITDRYASASAKPGPDTNEGGSNDITTSFLHYTDNKVGIAVFSRKIDTGDSKDVELSGSKYLFFARGPMSVNLGLADISKHNFKQRKPETFDCSPWTYLEESFPASKEDICQNVNIHRHVWEYDCLTYDFSIVPDHLDRCRSEISRRKCVYNVFMAAQVPCTLDDIISMSQQPFVRAFLLDSVNIGCESELDDTECVKSFVYEAADSAGMCFSPIQALNKFIYFDTLDNIENYKSADGQKSLKCSIFEELLKCYFSHVPTTASGTVCTPAEIAPAAVGSAHIAYYIIFNHDLGRGKPELTYDSCLAAIPSTMPRVPEKACPSRAAVADMVAAKCGSTVLTATIFSGDSDLCEIAGNSLKMCLEGFSIPNADLCPEDHLERSLREYSEFLAKHMKGFDYNLCTGDKVPVGCTTEYIKQMQLDPYCGKAFGLLKTLEDHWEKCRTYAAFLGCVKFQVEYAGISCPMGDMEMKAKQSASMAQYTLCKACEMPTWTVTEPGSSRPPSEVFVLRENKTNETQNDVLFTVKVYDFNVDTEWVGIGVSFDSSMPRSDVYTIQKKDNEWTVTDRWVPLGSRNKPEPDTLYGGTSSATLRSAKMVNGNLIAQFTRKVDTGDSDNDVLVSYDRQLLYARGMLVNNDISMHSFKAASPFYMFTCLPYDHMEQHFPKTYADICNTASSIRMNLQLYCLTYDISLLQSEEDRCRAELGRRHCVYMTFVGLNCTADQINSHLLKPEVRLGLLDHSNPGCEASLPDSTCLKHYYITADLTSECWSPLIKFHEYAVKSTDTDAEVNAILSFDQSKLKCRILEETVRCMLLKVPGFKTANADNSQCTPASVAPAIQGGLRMYYQVAKPTETVRVVSFSDCLAGMTSIPYPTKACPSKQSMADLIAAACTGEVLEALNHGTDAACGAFNRCFKELAFEGEEKCEMDYFDRALEETQYKDYLKRKFSGVLDPSTCRGCPVLREGTVGTCVEECSASSECSPGYVCCSNGCGHTCQARYIRGVDKD